MRLPAFCLLLISAFPERALAQTAPSSPQERRDQMAKVQEMLADPDPLLRLANMESIVNSGDSLRLQVALRAALSSDDADLRGLAMRAFLATRKEVVFDIVLPPPMQKQVDDARFDRSALQDLEKRFSFLPGLLGFASKFQLRFKDYAFSQDRGTVESANAANFSITGDKFSTLVSINNYSGCYIDFVPSRRLTFEGTMACGSWPKLSISAPIF